MTNENSHVGYKISLLSVSPGSKERVVAKLSKAIKEGTGSKPIAMLKLFGRYDLCAIYETDDYLSGPSKSGSIEGIRGGNQIFAFPYHSHREKKLLSAEAGPIWGLLFFRTNQLLTKQFGYLVEDVLSGYQANRLSKEGITLNVLGTTGWAELIFIVRGNTFASVTDTLSTISQTSVVITSGKEIKEHLFSAKTFSLVGIDSIYLKSPNMSKLPSIFNEAYDKTAIHPMLSITCSPGDMKTVYEYAANNLGDGFTTFGGKDFSIYPDKCKTWGILLKNLLEMRRDLSANIYSTFLEIHYPAAKQKFENYPSSAINNTGIIINSTLLALFKKWGPYFESRLLNLYFGISNLIQDPLVGDSFEDLRRSAAHHLPEALDSLSPDDNHKRSMVWEMMEALSYGAEERANGAFLSLENIENRFSPTKGGIQRILAAAQLLPHHVLSKIGLTWNGFVIAGFQRGFAECGEIMNLPLEYLFHPEEWWGFFHEIGHVALWKTEFLDLLKNEKIDSQLNLIVADPKFELQRLWWSNIFMEIAADSFDLFFCHKEINSFFRNILPYITQKTNKIEPIHFSRYFCMFQYWRYLMTKEEAVFPLRVDLESDLDSFLKILKKLRLNLNVSGEHLKEAKRIYSGVWPVIEICHRTYQDRKIKYLSKNGRRSDNTLRAINEVMRGKVFSDAIKHPDKFVLALKERSTKHKLSIDSRIAAILSLWHTSKIGKFIC